ncbi:hypothetical protein EYF80_042203 [Liparis tanakae]|uniref:Uncharacterized protein n=1 Tax=Liparis tanakae TaxID=230148 RepID=A0A4Z2G379_9TELE|nr:hypothetical protein EYF80_042203 [Liparis tanakae]
MEEILLLKESLHLRQLLPQLTGTGLGLEGEFLGQELDVSEDAEVFNYVSQQPPLLLELLQQGGEARPSGQSIGGERLQPLAGRLCLFQGREASDVLSPDETQRVLQLLNAATSFCVSLTELGNRLSSSCSTFSQTTTTS